MTKKNIDCLKPNNNIRLTNRIDYIKIRYSKDTNAINYIHLRENIEKTTEEIDALVIQFNRNIENYEYFRVIHSDHELFDVLKFLALEVRKKDKYENRLYSLIDSLEDATNDLRNFSSEYL